ncbi:bifunctional metallophosphatase/5'-nucleotidase [bacterium]|nr:bifunctional metallophosphatase/5'-nucleotidase [bacterium]
MKKLILLFLFSINFSVFAEETKISILFTNDVHGGIDASNASFINPNFPPPLGGGAAFATYVNKVRKDAEKNKDGVLLIDAGDIFQGTPIGTKTKGSAVIDFMNKIRFDLSVAGNHDFDEGKDNLKNLSEKSNFPILAANVIDRTTNEIPAYFKPYLIKEIQGIKIGVIGLATTGTEHMSFPENIKNLSFVPEIETAKKYVQILREQEKVDVVLLVGHIAVPYNIQEGYEKMLAEQKNGISRGYNVNALELVRQASGIDVFFGGHIHKGVREPWTDPVNHTLVIQNYGNGSGIGHLNIYVDKNTGTISHYDLPSYDGALITLFQEEIARDPSFAEEIDEKVREVETGLDEIIGETKKNLTRGDGESPMGNLVMDAMLEASGSDIGFSNYGGIRAEISEGFITPRSVFKVLPFENRLVVFEVTGKFLLELIESKVTGSRNGMLVSGAKIVYNPKLPDGEKVTTFEIGGKTVELEKTYKLVVTDYLAEGNSGFTILTTLDEKATNDTGTLMRECVMDYVKKHSPLKIGNDGRWVKNENASVSPELQQAKNKLN